MVREIINVSLGQCGNQINNSFWEIISKEHHLLPNGKFNGNNIDIQHNDKINVYFNETINQLKYASRSIIIDTDPSTLDKIKSSSIGSMFKADNFCFGSFSGGCSNNFAKGHYTDGAEMIDEIMDIIRKETELCDAPQGFQTVHSIGGGTGSGLGTLSLLKIRDAYPDIINTTYSIFPSKKVSDTVVEPYNATLSINQLLENSDQTHIIDNQALFNISNNILKQKQPKYDDLNYIVSNVMSDTTASLRFSGKLNGDLRKLGVNLVPYPRLHFFLISNAPLYSKSNANKINLTVQEITDQMWSSTNFLSSINSDDGKYNTAACIYRGNNIPTQSVDNEISKIQQKMADDFVTWIPNNIKSSLVNVSSLNASISGTLIANTTAIKGVFQRIAMQFQKMFKRKAFIHWYKGEGMDDMEFEEADRNNRDLITEYQDKQDAVVDLDGDDYDDDDDDDDDDCIGFAVGGARDVNNFRQLINQNILPSLSSITYNGLLYEYFFDTKTRKHDKFNTNTIIKNDDDDNKDNGSKLFYPSYCYAKIKKTDFIGTDISDIKDDFEYYMTIGLNSNIKKNDFKRKHLNIVIVLDQSGSMGDCFNEERAAFYAQFDNNQSNKRKIKTKMEIANEAVITLIKHLNENDRFGFILFDDRVTTIQKLELIKNINMDKLKKEILNIHERGGTNFEIGYKTAIQLYNQLNKNDINDGKYDNRIIYLTDAQPNNGITNPDSLFGMTTKYAIQQPHIYTTFIGIGLDFNSTLIETISNIRGSNYYAVKSSDDFIIKMDQDFEYMVTPLVFNVCLTIKCEGSVCEIEKVYGAKEKKVQNIMENGEITRINTLFPSQKSKKKGGIKGGIQLIKLKNNNKSTNNINVELQVTFEDRNGNKYKNNQIVSFNPPKLTVTNDMIDDDDDDDDDKFDNDENENFYDNLGIRKGILLCKYVELLHCWIEQESKRSTFKNKLFPKFLKYFQKEMKKCDDNELQKEVDILQKLINNDFKANSNHLNYRSDTDYDDDDSDF